MRATQSQGYRNKYLSTQVSDTHLPLRRAPHAREALDSGPYSAQSGGCATVQATRAGRDEGKRAGDPGEGPGVAETLIWIETHGGWSFLVKDLGAHPLSPSGHRVLCGPASPGYSVSWSWSPIREDTVRARGRDLGKHSVETPVPPYSLHSCLTVWSAG